MRKFIGSICLASLLFPVTVRAALGSVVPAASGESCSSSPSSGDSCLDDLRATLAKAAAAHEFSGQVVITAPGGKCMFAKAYGTASGRSEDKKLGDTNKTYF